MGATEGRQGEAVMPFKQIAAVCGGAIWLLAPNSTLAAGPPEIAVANGQAPVVDQIAPLGENNRTLLAAPDQKASALIGMTVRDVAGERIGKLQDIIVNLDSRTVPFAIIERGGALGMGRTRIAVPLRDLKGSTDPSQLTLMATKEDFDAAKTTPFGGWVALAGENWMKSVDRYYGEPSGTNNSARYDRREANGAKQGAETVNNAEKDLKAPNGQPEQSVADPAVPHQVVTPTDEFLMSKINAVIRQYVGVDGAAYVQVTLKEGLVTLKGKVASDAQRKLLESQIKVIGGVDRVQNDLSVSNY